MTFSGKASDVRVSPKISDEGLMIGQSVVLMVLLPLTCSCRSQMAHGILQALHPEWEVHPAGTKPARQVDLSQE